jgi:NAD(P)H-dependent FMN reductase
MDTKAFKILVIPGSLRTNSSSHIVLSSVAKLMPPHIEFALYDGLGRLPHFDGNEDAPQQVKELRAAVAAADAVLICSPEYAFGVPGSLKNALDWTVSSGEFSGKPVALITAATGGDKAHASLLLTLSAIDARVAEGAALLIPHIRAKIDSAEVTDPEVMRSLQKLTGTLVKAIGG